MLLHRLEQRRLCLGGRAVHLVRQHDIREHRPAHEPERALSRGLVLLDDLGPGNVGGHEIGRELDAGELEIERLRDGLHHQSLGESGHAEQ